MNRIVPPVALACLLAPTWVAQGFVERSTDLGIEHEFATGFDRVGLTSVFDWTQRGIALGDIDGDLDIDIICAGGTLTNTVLRNDGGVFTDISDFAGIEVGEFDSAPSLADYDGDGDLDLAIGVVETGNLGGEVFPGASRFYTNDGSGRFTEVTTLTGTVGKGHTIFTQWADIDLDGLPDLLCSEFFGVENLVYHNNGDGTFTDMSVGAGLNTPGSTHVTAVMDTDGNGTLDVLVGNDFVVGQWLPVENFGDQQAVGTKNRSWLNVTEGSGYGHTRGIMGLALGDVDYDGDLDVYKTDAMDNRLAINEGWPEGEPWHDQQDFYGVAAGLVPDLTDPGAEGRAIAWGAIFADFDFDLWLDLFLVNGQVAGVNGGSPFSPRNQRNFMFVGDGPTTGFKFTDATHALGLFDELDDRTLAVSDLDQDGDLDLLIGQTAGPLRYFENQVDPEGQGWLIVRPDCNTSAPGGFGVKARFRDSMGFPHERQIGLDGPTASQHENIAYFGLGHETSVDLEVEFPSGFTLQYPGTTPNQVVQAVEPDVFNVSARTLPLGASLKVEVAAHDALGNPLDASAAVTIAVPGLEPLGEVAHVHGNRFTRSFAGSAYPGAFRVRVTFDGWQVRIRPTVHYYDPDDASGTSGTVRPQAVRAGSSDTFRVIVAPKTAFGISLGPGRAVQVLIPGLTPMAPVQDLGDGRYSADFSAPAIPGKQPVLVRVDGMLVHVPGLMAEAGGSLIPAKSVMEKEVPKPAVSAAPHQFKLLLLPRDIDSRRLGPLGNASITVLEDPGTAPITLHPGTYAGGQPDGEYLWILEKPITTPPAVAKGQIHIHFDGSLVITDYEF